MPHASENEFGVLKPRLQQPTVRRPAASTARRASILQDSVNAGPMAKLPASNARQTTPVLAGTAARKRPIAAVRTSLAPTIRSRASLLPLSSDSVRKKQPTLPSRASLSKRPNGTLSQPRASIDAQWEDLGAPNSPPLAALEESLLESVNPFARSGLPRERDSFLQTPRAGGKQGSSTAGSTARRKKSKVSSTLEDLLAQPLDADGILHDSPTLAEISRELERSSTPIQAKSVSRLKASVSKPPPSRSLAGKAASEEKAAHAVALAALQAQLAQARAQAAEADNRAEILSAGHEDELGALQRKIEEQAEEVARSRGLEGALDAARWEGVAGAMKAERAAIRGEHMVLQCLAEEMELLEGMLRGRALL